MAYNEQEPKPQETKRMFVDNTLDSINIPIVFAKTGIATINVYFSYIIEEAENSKKHLEGHSLKILLVGSQQDMDLFRAVKARAKSVQEFASPSEWAQEIYETAKSIRDGI